MATIDDLRTQRSQLIKQLSGAKSVKHGDKAIENRDIKDIREAIKAIDDEIALVGGGKRRRQIRLYTKTGL